MRDELEALERIRKKLAKHYNSIEDIYEWTSIEDDLDIIGNVFKEKENTDKTIIELFSDNGKVISIFEIKKKLIALDMLKELFDFDFAIRFGSNQCMLKITNKRTNEYWELLIQKDECDLLKEVLPSSENSFKFDPNNLIEKPAGWASCEGCKHFKPIYKNNKMIYDCEKVPIKEGEACPFSCAGKEMLE